MIRHFGDKDFMCKPCSAFSNVSESVEGNERDRLKSKKKNSYF